MELKIDVRKKYEKFDIDISLETKVNRLGIMGPSGAGKTQLAKMFAGIVRPDEGTITLNGRILFDSEKGINVKPQDRNIGYIFQNYALFPNMTVAENIKVAVHDKKTKESECLNLLNKMNLNTLANKYPDQLSSGEKQRTALARTLASKPQIIIFDEPFSALDSYLKFEIENEIFHILEDINIPYIIISHSLDEIYRLSDDMAVISNGRAKRCGEKNSVLSKPKFVTVAKILGCNNISQIEVDNIGKVVEAVSFGLEFKLNDIRNISGICEFDDDKQKYFIGIKNARIVFDNSINAICNNSDIEEKNEKSFHFRTIIDREVENIDNYAIFVKKEENKKCIAVFVEKDTWHLYQNSELYKEGYVEIKIYESDIFILC